MGWGEERKYIAQKIYFFMQYSIFIAQNRLIYNHKFRPIEGFVVSLTY